MADRAIIIVAGVTFYFVGILLVRDALERFGFFPASSEPVVPPEKHAIWIDRRTGKLHVNPAPPPDTGRGQG